MIGEAEVESLVKMSEEKPYLFLNINEFTSRSSILFLKVW